VGGMNMTTSHVARLTRSVALVAAAIALVALAGCATSAPQPTAQHQTYTYNRMFGPSNDHWKPGQQIAVSWAPRTGPMTSDAAPAHVALTLQLFGPYASIADLKAATDSTAAAPTAGSATPIATDTWSGKSFDQTLTLPATLAPGYYNLVQKMTQSTSSGGSYSASGASVLVIGG
ncbi:MAG: hypothetical protein ACRDHP_18805, partial [Ktedonobacterales bacterium]